MLLKHRFYLEILKQLFVLFITDISCKTEERTAYFFYSVLNGKANAKNAERLQNSFLFLVIEGIKEDDSLYF